MNKYEYLIVYYNIESYKKEARYVAKKTAQAFAREKVEMGFKNVHLYEIKVTTEKKEISY